MRDARAARRSIARGAAVALTALGLSACGKEGPPLPPLRPEPGHIREVAGTRNATLIELRLAIPPANFDGTTPPVMERVEIYAITQPASVAAPGATELFNQKFLYKVIPVRRDDEGQTPSAPQTKEAPMAVPGSTFVFTDLVDQAQLSGADKPVRYYLVAGATGRSRRGRPSPVLTVPLTASPVAPAKVDATNDEKTVTLTWETVEGQTYRVFEMGARAAIDPGKELTTEPLAKGSFQLPAWFGSERCFAVQPSATSARVTIVGTPGGPFCHTPADTYAPPAPSGLLAVQEPKGIALRWSAIEAPDLAGYLVLRAAGAGETLQQLFRAPIAETTFVDTAVTAGVTYTYAVIAIDKAGNVSPQSGRQQVTARLPPANPGTY